MFLRTNWSHVIQKKKFVHDINACFFKPLCLHFLYALSPEDNHICSSKPMLVNERWILTFSSAMNLFFAGWLVYIFFASVRPKVTLIKSLFLEGPSCNSWFLVLSLLLIFQSDERVMKCDQKIYHFILLICWFT